MSGGLKQQWGVGDPVQVGPDEKSDPDAAAKKNQQLKSDLRKWNKMQEFPEVPKGPPVAPGPAVPRSNAILIENCDFSKGPGKRALNRTKVSNELAKRSDGTKGRIQIVAYFDEVVDGTDEDQARRSNDNQNQATENARKTAQARSMFKGRIDKAVERRGSSNPFGLSGADAAALGTHEVAVIFVP